LQPVAIQGNLIGRDAGGPHGVGASDEGTMYTLTKADVHGVAHAAVAFDWQSGGDSRGLDPRPTAQLQRCQVPAVAIGTDCYNGQITGDIAATMGTPGSSVNASGPTVMQAIAVAPTLTAANDPSRSPQSAEVTKQVAAVHAATMAVRRLTPVECERLQGFPDGYTAIPWRGKPAAECPDGPRYRALGNSMAVPCMRWIGERIAQVDALDGR
jgi:DNA (cytosine-5)-methyltransferase 1